MARALSFDLRRRIVNLSEQGVAKSEIARRLSISRGSVYTILERHAERGLDGLCPDYKNCGPKQPFREAFLVRSYCALRRWNPNDGYDRISSKICAKYGEQYKIPNRSTVYRWWHARGLVPPRTVTQPGDPNWTNILHEVWQVDAKEKMKLLDGQRYCWLNVVDEASGTVIDPPVFSTGGICQVAPRSVQQYFISIFSKWGCPLKIKVDNGRPLGDPSRRMVPKLALWLVGMGIEVIFNPPRSPQKNGKVERSQGTLGRWTDFENCQNGKELEKRLAKESHFYNHIFRDRRKNDQTRKERFPTLGYTGRNFDERSFNLQLVYDFLSCRSWGKRVSKAGQINHATERIYVGKQHIGKVLSVNMNAETGQWEIRNHMGEYISSHPFGLTPQDIINLRADDDLECLDL